MKTFFTFLTSVMLLSLLSSSAIAACWKDNGGCARTAHYYPSRCQYSEYPASCQAADTGYLYNDCVSKYRYNEAFGNIGAR